MLSLGLHAQANRQPRRPIKLVLCAHMKRAFILSFVVLLSACSDPCKEGEDLAEASSFEPAILKLDACLSDPSNHSSGLFQTRAWAHFKTGNLAGAVTDQEQAFEVKPAYRYGEHINYVLYLRSNGEYEKALKALEPAIEMNPGSMPTNYHRGWILISLGRFEEAANSLSVGLLDQPDFAFAYAARAIAYDSLGNIEAAQRDYYSYRALLDQQDQETPDYPPIVELERKYRMEQGT